MSDIDILRTYSEDLLDNQFMITIPAFPEVGNLENLNIRVTDIDIPDQVIETYEVLKRGKGFTRPTGSHSQGNEFTFSYRIDKYMDAYKSISRWMNFIKDTRTGAMASDSGPLGAGGPSLFRIPITVQAIDTNDIVLATWSMEGCFPTNQAGISFTVEGGNPIVVAVTMQYVHINYPN